MNTQNPSEPPNDVAVRVWGSPRRRVFGIIIFSAYFAYAQREYFVAKYDPLLAFAAPLFSMLCGVWVAIRLRRICGTAFSSYLSAFIFISLIMAIQYGAASLLEAAGLRKLVVWTTSGAILFFLVAALAPLVDAPRRSKD